MTSNSNEANTSLNDRDSDTPLSDLVSRSYSDAYKKTNSDPDSFSPPSTIRPKIPAKPSTGYVLSTLEKTAFYS
jgi:hypothetical protein